MFRDWLAHAKEARLNMTALAIEARGKCLAQTEPVAVHHAGYTAGLLHGTPVPAPDLAVQHQYFSELPADTPQA